MLEQAWDHRYQKMVRSIRETLQGQGVVCKKEKVDERFGYLEKLINLGAEPSGWLPLLFLNGSSVTTGRRIIVADATPWYCVRAERDPHTLEPRLFYSKAFDFFEIAGSSAIDAGTGHVQSRAIKNDDACDPHRRYEAAYNEAPDIRLSTAAAMSARFPIISPHGAIRNLSNRVVDQVVDGGYFENDGLATALDIAKALKDFDLKPLVIRITNELLSAPPSPAQDALYRPRLPQAGEATLFHSYITPFTGLYNTRSGHGAEAARAILSIEDGKGIPEYVHIGVYGALPNTALTRQCRSRADQFRYPETMREVSISWWLSQPVQQYLDAQLCHDENERVLKVVLECVLTKRLADDQSQEECVQGARKQD